jgi:hypothetical protein
MGQAAQNRPSRISAAMGGAVGPRSQVKGVQIASGANKRPNGPNGINNGEKIKYSDLAREEVDISSLFILLCEIKNVLVGMGRFTFNRGD